MNNLVLIAAIGKNNEIGKENKLIWYLPNDLKFTNIKHITNKSNEKHELYLKVFLKIFSSLDLIQYFKKPV